MQTQRDIRANDRKRYTHRNTENEKARSIHQFLYSRRSFYANRIYLLSEGSLYLPAAISLVSLTEFGVGIAYSAKILKHIREPDPGSFEGFFIATLACKVPCDVLITTGMVYYLLSNRSQVRRKNNVLNLLAIYSVNCGILHLVFAIVCVTLFTKYPDTLIYSPSLFIMFRLSLCAFMAILNSRDHLRETLDGSGGVVAISQLRVCTGTSLPWGAQETAEASTNAAVPKSLSPALVSSDTLPSRSVIAFDREKYPVPPVMQLGSN
ncbi:hypothetical protein EDB92DRAFT_1955742 [Lactarius akahatsu]|uniref:DUF6534 domain-containing protein n=1 Tax=Lactarius akahatsu TaxID=416441 RepID=A0AAD4L3M0_9AGAM|nr:hypothetical protein EDB92DRAFT_1955742 [Lactarius akahatsu]